MRSFALRILILALFAAPATAAPMVLAVLPLELLDDTSAGAEQGPDEIHRRRLAAAAERLRAGLAGLAGVRVVDGGQVAELLRSRPQGLSLHACNGCELDLARALDADRVVIGWVQKVSNLILNLNVVVRDVATGRTVATAFVDLRGDNDRSWEKAMDYLLEHLLLPRLSGA